MQPASEAIAHALVGAGARVHTSSLTDDVLPRLVNGEPSISDKEGFLECEVGRLAHTGLNAQVRRVAKTMNGKTSVSAALHGQTSLFSDLPVRASVPSGDGDYEMVEIDTMDRDEFLVAAGFKVEKGRQAIDEGEKMFACYREHKELWDAHPEWTVRDLKQHLECDE